MGGLASVTVKNDTVHDTYVKFSDNTHALLAVGAGFATAAAVVSATVLICTGVGAAAGVSLAVGGVAAVTTSATATVGMLMSAGVIAAGAVMLVGGPAAVLIDMIPKARKELENTFVKDGYQLLKPGEKSSLRLLPNVNQRAWVIRIRQTKDALYSEATNISVWSAPSAGADFEYLLSDEKYFYGWQTITSVRFLPTDLAVAGERKISDFIGGDPKSRTYNFDLNIQPRDEMFAMGLWFTGHGGADSNGTVNVNGVDVGLWQSGRFTRSVPVSWPKTAGPKEPLDEKNPDLLLAVPSKHLKAKNNTVTFTYTTGGQGIILYRWILFTSDTGDAAAIQNNPTAAKMTAAAPAVQINPTAAKMPAKFLPATIGAPGKAAVSHIRSLL